jgi:hypothetical protein
MKNDGGHFTPKFGGHFELESGGHFKLELGGQYHWNLQSPGTEVNNFNPIPLLKDAKTFSDLFSTQLEIAGTLKDARNTTSSETKRDSITESFMVNMKGDLQIRADSPKQRDSLINSPNGTTSWYSLKK